MRKRLQDMNLEELQRELDILNEIRERGDFLSPDELMREDAALDFAQDILEKEGR